MSKGIFELEMAKEPEGDNILIVDSLNLAFRYKHMQKSEFAEDYYKTVKSLARSYGAATIILACDWGKSEFRKALYPDYKADREAKVALQTPEEQEQFKIFFEGYEKAMDYCKSSFHILKYKGVEADDIAAYLTHYIFKNTKRNIWLISSDKDWDLLLGDKVHRFSYVTRKEYSLENWDEYYEYPHDIALDVKVLVGGKDNVTGIPGVGPKRAHTLLKQYNTAFDVYDNIPLPGKAVYIKNTNEFGDKILRNLQLIDKITYCKDAIGCNNLKDINDKCRELRWLAQEQT
jgi:5'-3' exonuclease